MVIDHIGIVVPSLEESIRQWEEWYGYHKNSDIVENTRQQVRVVFLAKPDSLTIKLVEPIGVSSPVMTVSRRGGGLHHLCFRCDDLTSQLAHWEKKGAMVLVKPQPGEAFGNRDISFVLAEGNINIELIDTTEKVGWGKADEQVQS
jgi:methylmalonyl-CoA/ethylmalonyl-CoA epimerase